MTITPTASISAGEGLIHAKLLPPSRLVLPALSFKYPLKLISPAPSRTAKCLIVFMLSYGGGLVSGDQVDLKVIVEKGAKLCLQTQGSTKVFKRDPAFAYSPTPPTSPILTSTPLPPGSKPLTSQRIDATLQPNSSLIILPDPIQPFAESAFSQRQTIRMLSPETTSVLVLDWVTEGRGARGERWKLTRFETRTELCSTDPEGTNADRLLLRDALMLEGDDDDTNGINPSGGVDEDALYASESLYGRQDGQTCFATLIVHGPKFKQLAEHIASRYRTEPRVGAKRWDDSEDAEETCSAQAAEAKAAGVMWTTSSVRGCQLVKISGRDVEAVRNFVRVILQEGKAAGDEDEDEVGSIEREFGASCLRCVE